MSNPTAPPARPARLLSLILLTLLAFVGLGASPAMATEDNPVGACLSLDPPIDCVRWAAWESENALLTWENATCLRSA